MTKPLQMVTIDHEYCDQLSNMYLILIEHHLKNQINVEFNMKKIFRFFLQGLLYIAPIGITLYILYVIFSFVDGLLQEWLEELLSISIPGLGLLITVAIWVVGVVIMTVDRKYIAWSID